MNETKPPLPLFEHTVFINLAERTDRLAHIQQELRKLHISEPIRFNAVKTNVGRVGCSMSHLKCLEMAKQAGWKQVFICEDDAVFTNPPLLINTLSKAPEEWDVLIVGGNNQRPFFHKSPEFIQVHNCQTTTAYIVQQAYYDRLIQNVKEGIQKLLREPKMKHLYSIDIYWKDLQIQDTWLMAIPATVTQLEGVSDIEGKTVSYSQMMLDYEKSWLNTPPSPHSGSIPITSFRQTLAPHSTPVVPPPPSTPVSQTLGKGWGKGFLGSMPKQKTAPIAMKM